MALMTPPRATVTISSTYEVGGLSTATTVGHPLAVMAPGVAIQPQVIDDLCIQMDNLEYTHGVLTRNMETVSDTEVANSISIGFPLRAINLSQVARKASAVAKTRVAGMKVCRGHHDVVHAVDGGTPHCFGEETSRTASGASVVISFPFLPCCAAGTDNRPPMLEESDFTSPYSEPLAITTTTAFEVSHEDAYDSDVDEAPHASAAFMANLMQTGPSTGKGINFDVDSVIDDHDNTIPYYQYQLNNEVESVPTDKSSVVPGGISVITILDDLRSQLTGHIKTNKEQSFANDSLKAELERYKTQVQNLEQKQLVSLKQQLLQHVESNKSLKIESEKLKADKNALEESYLEELVWLRNTNKVVTELLQSYGQPVQTVPMLSKRPTFSTKDLHKSALGHRNPLYLKSAQLCRPTLYLGDVIVDPVHTPFRVYDSEETLVQAEVSRTKMLERMKDPLCKVSSKPINYAKLNSLYDTFVPQKQFQEDAYNSDVDEAPHAAAAFITNLMQTGPSTGLGTSNNTDFHSEVQTYNNHLFDNMNLQVSQEIHGGEQLDSDVDSVTDDHDNIIPYHQYQLNNKVESVPTDVSSVVPGGISVITILDDLRSQLAGHIKTNEEQSFDNDSLRDELERYKTQVQNLEQSKVKKDLEQLVFERNKRNADLEEQLVSLKQQLLQ
ncbi:hypothetical protein Tco_0099450 [Tanacetum coccineum]